MCIVLIFFSPLEMSDSRTDIAGRWAEVENPKHLRITLPVLHVLIITCVELSNGRIIVATNAAPIFVYIADTGSLLHTLSGHQGGVWAMSATKDTLVSGSMDKTIRIWDLRSGICTHVYGGGTVRCLQIVKPEWYTYTDPDTRVERKELWPAPNRPYFVTGSRDHSVRLWSLPRVPTQGEEIKSWDPTEVNVRYNATMPFFKKAYPDLRSVEPAQSESQVLFDRARRRD